jgi:hypothetical protein
MLDKLSLDAVVVVLREREGIGRVAERDAREGDTGAGVGVRRLVLPARS